MRMDPLQPNGNPTAQEGQAMPGVPSMAAGQQAGVGVPPVTRQWVEGELRAAKGEAITAAMTEVASLRASFEERTMDLAR